MIKKLLFLLKLSLFIVFFSSVSHSAPKISVENDDYLVSGENIAAIRYNIRKKGPKSPSGHGFAAITNYDISWDYKFDQTESGCSIKSAQSYINISYKMPKLRNYSSVSDDLKGKWDNYYNSLSIHEKGHANFGIKAAYAIEKIITNMPAQANCQKLSKKANDLGKGILHEYHNYNIRYDKYTGHGHKQGAVLL